MASVIVQAEVLLDFKFKDRPALENISEGGTIYMWQDPLMTLGGQSTTGEKAGFRTFAPEEFNDFTFELKNLFWSHEQALGGHQTEISFLNSAKQGYVVSFSDGNIALFRQDGPGEREQLAADTGWWNPADGFTVHRDLVVKRGAEGDWRIAFAGLDKHLTAKDQRYKDLVSVSMQYRVFIPGYAFSAEMLKLENDQENSKAQILFFDPWKSTQSPVAALVKELKKAGLPVAKYDDEIYKLNAAKTPCLILSGTSLSRHDLRGLLDFLRAGGKVMIWGELDWDTASAEGKLFLERILGLNITPRPRGCSDFQLTASGRAYPELVKAFAQAKFDSLALIPINNSIEKQVLLPHVERIDLARADYRAGNWVQLNDVFYGTPLQLTIHHRGEFTGGRILYAGFPAGKESPLNPENPGFATFFRGAVSALNQPETPFVSFNRAAELTRENFLDYPGAVMGTLCFASYEYLDNDKVFDEDMAAGGFQFACYCIPWLTKVENGEVVDWEKLDWIVEKVALKGLKIMLDTYPYNFNPASFTWQGQDAAYNPQGEKLWIEALGKIARRYKNNPAVVAMWCSPYTHSGDFRVADTPAIRGLWSSYLRDVKRYTLADVNQRYGLALKNLDDVPVPQPNPDLPYNIGPMWSDYLEFHIDSYQNFLRKSIRAIRAEIPEMPLTIRTAFMDPAPAMAVAAEFPNVSTHIECIETTVNTEGFYRSLAQNFKVPVTAENGWPKAPVAAMNLVFGDLMLGNYPIFTYSFAGPRWLRKSFNELNRYSVIRQEMARAEYPKAQLGLILPDTTLFGSRPASFFAIEKLPSLELTMERSGYAFYGVSAQIPKLDGLSVLLDSGTNRVFTRTSIDAFAEFMQKGGTFIGFPDSGAYCFDGGKGFLESLKVPAKPGTYKVGKGKLLLLEDVTKLDIPKLSAVFQASGLKPYVELNAPVCNALYVDGNRKYLAMFNKKREFVGSFFTESIHEKTVEKLPAVELEIKPGFPFRSVKRLPEKTAVPFSNGVVRLTMPAAEPVVLLFE